ncbi:clr5 domain-containing protein [Purpureocillium lavendulum]|uniref:Clr5 domain-containing protein n=1 Tax=Purpureocillium lavendulum TaxID=1247861 RepID=A0AB34G1W2_9HYPO|nr:clr5 domain-containing protein [Purpureocillium lavendulum]
MHAACAKLKWIKIKDLKQHIGRKHSPDFFCERCFEVFKSQADHHAHVMSTTEMERCPPRPDAPSGCVHVTNYQKTQLAKRSSRKKTWEEQWYAIWDILFEDSIPPQSPYLESEDMKSFDLEDFERYCAPRIAKAVMEHLNESTIEAMQRTSQAEKQEQMELLIGSQLRTSFEEYTARNVSSLAANGTPLTDGSTLIESQQDVPCSSDDAQAYLEESFAWGRHGQVDQGTDTRRHGESTLAVGTQFTVSELSSNFGPYSQDLELGAETTHVDIQTAQAQFDDQTVPVQFVDQAVPCHFDGQAAPVQFVDQTVPCHFDGQTFPAYLDSETVPPHLGVQNVPIEEAGAEAARTGWGSPG